MDAIYNRSCLAAREEIDGSFFSLNNFNNIVYFEILSIWIDGFSLTINTNIMYRY